MAGFAYRYVFPVFCVLALLWSTFWLMLCWLTADLWWVPVHLVLLALDLRYFRRWSQAT